jgi:vitamin B12 transporter
MARHLLLGASLLALISATAPAAFAEDAAASNTVTPLVVTTSRSGDATPADLVGASVTVIDDQALHERQTVIVSDVLRDVPGVAVSRTGAVGTFTSVRIRGAEGNQTLVLIDGVKASDPYYDEYDFGTMIADPDARIEVLRGQQSSLYGSDAIGGVISYTTLTGAEAPGVHVRTEMGSMGTFDGGGRVAGVQGDLDYAVSVSGARTTGYPVAVGGERDVGSESLGASAKLIWAATPNLHFTAVGRYSYTDADTDDVDNDFSSPTFGLTIDSPGVHYVNKAVYGLLRGQLDLLDGRWTNAVTLQVADTKRTGFDVADPYSPPAGQPIVESYGDKGDRFKQSFVSAYRFGDDKVKQRVTVAFDAEQDTAQNTVATYGAYVGKNHINTSGLVGEYDVTLYDRASFDASVRHDWNNRFADDTTYRVEASYKFDMGLRLHAAAGSGVKDPSFSELFDYYAGHYIGNPDLQPEKSNGWEAGVDYTFLQGDANIGATYFHSHLTEEIALSYATGVAQPVNLPGSNPQHGVEVFGNLRILDAWRIDLSYTHLDAPQHSNVLIGGVSTDFYGQAVRRAQNIASVNLNWAPVGKPYTTTLTVRYNGAQNDFAYTDPSYEPVLVNLKAFTLVDLGATWSLDPKVELYGRIENLFNDTYQEVFSYATPGRAVYGGIRLRF